MFFIIWGSKGATAHIGPAGVMQCGRCDQDAYFAKMVAYRVRHIYWLFRWITHRSAFLQCGNCGAEYHADHDMIAAKAARAAIPFWDRRGWTVGLGGIASLFALGSIAAATNTATNRTYVQAPHVGDIYEADMARMVKNPEAPVMLSALRVTNIRGGVVEVALARSYYGDGRGLDRDLNDGKGADPDYYSDTKLAIPVSDLGKLYDEGVVKDVRR